MAKAKLTESEYKNREYLRFLKSSDRYFDTVKEMVNYHNCKNSLELFTRDLEWIVNGSYGAGACLALQQVYTESKTNKRINKLARVGQILLHVYWGSRFNHWQKLPAEMQNELNLACQNWLDTGDHDFSIKW